MSDRRILVVYDDRKAVKPYCEALEAVDLVPVLAAANNLPGADAYDGVLLMGGVDVDPVRYGETRQERTEEPDPARDQAEAEVIDHALTHDLPVLGICRGLQILNVQLGGTLIQDLPRGGHHEQRTGDKGSPAHQVAIEDGTLLGNIAGAREWQVNSRHHQAVKRLGGGLVITARDPTDGVIEGVEIPDKRWVVAVQWHPENMALKDPEQRKLFQAFADQF